jgi:hypothetical protein
MESAPMKDRKFNDTFQFISHKKYDFDTSFLERVSGKIGRIELKD